MEGLIITSSMLMERSGNLPAEDLRPITKPYAFSSDKFRNCPSVALYYKYMLKGSAGEEVVLT